MSHQLEGKDFLYRKGVSSQIPLWHPGGRGFSQYTWWGGLTELNIANPKKYMSQKFYTPHKKPGIKIFYPKKQVKDLNTSILIYGQHFPRNSHVAEKIEILNNFLILWSQLKFCSEMCKPKKCI